jgi:hypothetical protein
MRAIASVASQSCGAGDRYRGEPVVRRGRSARSRRRQGTRPVSRTGYTKAIASTNVCLRADERVVRRRPSRIRERRNVAGHGGPDVRARSAVEP